MEAEAREAPAAALRQIARLGPVLEVLAERLRRDPPPLVVTCARGSSDHAAVYGKYLIETRTGVPVVSLAPSVVSVYGVRPHLAGALFIAVSQSGRSPDLLRAAEAARAAGVITVALVNDEASPLAALCEYCLPLCAGPEVSVAATKSYLMACAALLRLTAAWTGQADLAVTASRLPEILSRAMAVDWGPALAPLATTGGLYVLGRGIGLGAALEMALKFKETCRLHAEAFSAAEVVHGPLALVGPGFPVLLLGQADAARPGLRAVAERLVGLGGQVLTTEAGIPGTVLLPTPDDIPAEVMPLAQVVSFYLAIPAIARARGLDPDRPGNLTKVTETV
jgi:glucosamine--fructose-6-phosphate aminotransferase (isomerizing)